MGIFWELGTLFDTSIETANIFIYNKWFGNRIVDYYKATGCSKDCLIYSSGWMPFSWYCENLLFVIQVPSH